MTTDAAIFRRHFVMMSLPRSQFRMTCNQRLNAKSQSGSGVIRLVQDVWTKGGGKENHTKSYDSVQGGGS